MHLPLPGPHRLVSFLVLAGLGLLLFATGLGQAGRQIVPGQILFDLGSSDSRVQREATRAALKQWDPSYVPVVLDLLWGVGPQSPFARELWALLEKGTGKKFPRQVYQWLQWNWEQEFEPHPDYPALKGERYALVDEGFRRWFYPGMKANIRLDEILWGGVRVDGIPPLEHPKFLAADEAKYLGNGNIVFGVFIGGQAKAYPKRILAWHELFNDTVGSQPVTCAYCTLCGAAVLYSQKIGERKFDFGTSGFLYRSNKLMYDRPTGSLWSALEGIPVTGELADSGYRLERLPIVTTTWGEWKRRHPDSLVLSLETGHRRDYGEGVAYRDYFATHDLMFPVPVVDSRLQNKQEVLAVFVAGKAVAFDIRFLKNNPVHHERIGSRSVVILTDESGAARVYQADEVTFREWDRKSMAHDARGGEWAVGEEALVSPEGTTLRRLAANRVFWFGWFAQFPEARLVQ